MEPLAIAPREVSPAAGAPEERPQFTESDLPTPPLAALAPGSGPMRDGRQPFSVATMTMTQQTSAWGAAHSSILQPPGTATAAGGFDPTRPFQVAVSHDPRKGPPATGGFAPPTTAPIGASFAPPAGVPMGVPRPQAGPVGVADIWRELTPGVVISLAIGCFLPFLSLIGYSLAIAFATRVQRERATIRNVFIGGASVIGLVALVALFTADRKFADWWMIVGWWSLAACWLTLPIVAVLIYRSLTGGKFSSTPF